MCALRDGSAPGEVRVVAVNADGLLCEYSADCNTGAVALERECSVDDYDGGGFPNLDGDGGGAGGGGGRLCPAGRGGSGEGTSGRPAAGARRI